MRRYSLAIGLLTMLTSVGALADAGSVPALISYQGSVTGADGQPIQETTRRLEFRIWDHADSTDPAHLIWGPQVFDTAAIVKGQFQVALGETDAEGRSITDAFGVMKPTDPKERYVGIKVGAPGSNLDTEAEVGTRQQLFLTPYGMVSGNGVPIGGIISWIPPVRATTVAEAEAQLPANFAICDGPDQADNSDTAFDERLIPELTNYYLMGDSVSQIGKSAETTSHSHSFSGTTQGPDARSADYTDKNNPGGRDEPIARSDHVHAYSGSTDAAAPEPQYLNVVMIIRVN